MQEINFLTSVHKKTKRDYLARVSPDRPECARTIKRWDGEYWDGDRKNGYGGHYYDGRWYPVAEEMAAHYKLKAGDRILDVGCGYRAHRKANVLADIQDLSQHYNKRKFINNRKVIISRDRIKGMIIPIRITNPQKSLGCFIPILRSIFTIEAIYVVLLNSISNNTQAKEC